MNKIEKKFLKELCEENGDTLCPYIRVLQPHENFENIETVFNYELKHGGTIDGFRYYNDYYILKNLPV